MLTDGQSPAFSDRPVTRSAGEELGAFRLAEHRADRLSWPWPGDRTAVTSWRTCPRLPHGCDAGSRSTFTVRLLAGARPEDVAAALGNGLGEAFRVWHEWVSAQRV